MPPLDRPKLRAVLDEPFVHQGRSYVLLRDPAQVFREPVLVPTHLYTRAVRHFDGYQSLAEIQDRALREDGHVFAPGELERLVDQLDRALVLDGPAFASFQADYGRRSVRPPALAGLSYRGTEHALRAQLSGYFAHAEGAGPRASRPQNGASSAGRVIRGVLSPHIDFERGGPVYTWAYRALAERCVADTFVILGVAHQPCRRRFALTRKDFRTPLGIARTDLAYVDRLAEAAGEPYFDDELAHRTEHSIEFQVVFLQYVLGSRPFTIVPILVGSFHDLLRRGVDPIEAPDVRRFVAALRRAEAESGRKVAYVGGIDLCHVGPEFGDADPVDDATLAQVRAFDTDMLRRAAAVDATGWFGTAAYVGDRWRVCGLSATYTMLHAIGPARGDLLKYGQAVNPERTCCVTFASVAFESTEGTGRA